MALLRCKALSFLVNYGACPVVTTLARKVLELTKDVGHWKLVHAIEGMRASSWEKENLFFAIHNENQIREVSECSRDLVERKFGLSKEQQLCLEEWIEGWRDLKPKWDAPRFLEGVVHPDVLDYTEKYVIFEPHPYGQPPIFLSVSDALRQPIMSRASETNFRVRMTNRIDRFC